MKIINLNYKTSTKSDKRSVEYRLKKESGPPYNKRFLIEVVINDIIYGVGEGLVRRKLNKMQLKKPLNKLVTK